MVLVISTVVVTNIRENLISYLLMMEGVFGQVYYYKPKWLKGIFKTMDYFKTLHPFIIATFILIIIRYLACDDQEDDDATPHEVLIIESPSKNNSNIKSG